MLGNKKNVFWEALLLTGVVFVFGLLLGVAFEAGRVDKINEFYARSEVSMMDIFALSNIVDSGNFGCEELISSNIKFADRIYEEARVLDRYEASGRLSESIKLSHKKYDVLRAFLWINVMKTRENCGKGFSSVIYLYESEPEDLAKKATQNVWSKILFDLKQEKGSGIILIPIAVDGDLVSTDFLLGEFNISSSSDLPVVIVNDRVVLKDLVSVEDLNKELD